MASRNVCLPVLAKRLIALVYSARTHEGDEMPDKYELSRAAQYLDRREQDRFNGNGGFDPPSRELLHSR